MAGEYSRELSSKVFQSLVRRASNGNFCGGVATYGLRRYFYDQKGNLKGIGDFKEWKNHRTYYTCLGAAPEEEVCELREIFRKFVEDKMLYHEIAADLTARKVPPPPTAKSWNAQLIWKTLQNEKYIGSNLFYRTTQKLSTKMRKVPREHQVRIEDAFPPVIDKELFMKAQERLASRNIRALDRLKMLDDLRALLKEHGRLSSTLITKIPNGHAPFMYRKYFGSLENAYALVGFHRYNQDNEKYAKFAKTYHLNRIWIKELKDNLRHAGFHVTLFKQSGLIINRCLVVTVRCIVNEKQRNEDRLYIYKGCDVVLAYFDSGHDDEADCFIVPKSAFRSGTVSAQASEIKPFLSPWHCIKSEVIPRLSDLLKERQKILRFSEVADE